MTFKQQTFLKHQDKRKFKLLGLSILIGIIGGLGAVLFREMISFVNMVLYELPNSYFNSSPIMTVISPTIGGLIVGALVYYFAREAKGHGVPEIVESVNLNDGKMRVRVPFIKILASAITIGSGGSAGREGPIAQIGGGAASAIAQKMNLSKDEAKTLVIAGVSAGISATFNAPLGGVLFGYEVIRRDQKQFNIFPLIISSVVATTVGEIFLGTEPAFIFPRYGEYDLISNIPFFILLGVIMAIFAIFWTKSFYFIEDALERIKISPILLAGLGGLGVGIIELFIPEVNGITYAPIDNALALKYTVLSLILYTFAKLVATALSIGSGGSGGIFAPTLFQGVMLGTAYGLILYNVGFSTANADIFALLGMAALFAASARAPLTAIIMISEMVNDFNLIIPLMFTVVTAWIISTMMMRDDIYIIKLKRRGVAFSSAIDILDDIQVSEIMITNPITVSPKDRIEDVLEIMHNTNHTGFPVVEGGILKGIITEHDIDRALTIKEMKLWSVNEICSKKLFVITPNCSLSEAFIIFAKKGINRLPVVEKHNKKLVGWLTRSDIMRFYLKKKSLNIVEEYEMNTLENL